MTKSANAPSVATADGAETISLSTTKVTSVAHFELQTIIGTGAFGSVWQARDTELDRIVAVKIPRRRLLDSHESDYFVREARAAAQLSHPNIVAVHEVGEVDGTLYIVSDFIRGLSLADWLTGQQPTPKEAAELCCTIAQALHYAHERGVIHRDLKPANILLDQELRPHLADFGLAKREAGEITMTVEGQLLGTPAYMSPEQAQGDAHNADRRADVYSLGVVLYELLTGHRPFRGNTRMLLHQVMHHEPSAPRKFDRTIPKDIETICLKCLEKDPSKRYQSAQELADELQRFIHGKPIKSRAVGRIERVGRWCRREPGLAVLGGISFLLFLVLAIGGPVVALHQRTLKKEAVTFQDKLRLALIEVEKARRAEKSARLAMNDLVRRLGDDKLKTKIEELPVPPSFSLSETGIGIPETAFTAAPNMIGD